MYDFLRDLKKIKLFTCIRKSKKKKIISLSCYKNKTRSWNIYYETFRKIRDYFLKQVITFSFRITRNRE